MTSLTDYIDRAHGAEKKLRLRRQWASAVSTHTVECCCGRTLALELAYRCLYCGEWYCPSCAEAHFGQTVQEWVLAKRAAERAKVELRLKG